MAESQVSITFVRDALAKECTEAEFNQDNGDDKPRGKYLAGTTHKVSEVSATRWTRRGAAVLGTKAPEAKK